MHESVEVIAKFPETPTQEIIYYVYNVDMVSYVENLIVEARGQAYLDKYVTVTPIGDGLTTNVKNAYMNNISFSAYFDPSVFKYKNLEYN